MTFSHLSGDMQQFLTSHREQYKAAARCTPPNREWTEEDPVCSSPFCGSYTGLWLPSIDEVDGDAETAHKYQCGSYMWAR